MSATTAQADEAAMAMSTTTTTPICEICESDPSKYKCPKCALRYCSLVCYKTHKPSHAEESSNLPSSSSEFRLAPRDRPGTKQRVSKRTFDGFEKDGELQRLLARYPRLKTELGAVYGMTMEPAPDEMRSWNRVPSFLVDRGGRGQSRGRGSRGRGGGVGGGKRRVERRRWFDAEREEDRQHGAWTKDKATREALGILERTRSGLGAPANAQADARREGFEEFVQLCMLRFAEKDGEEDG